MMVGDKRKYNVMLLSLIAKGTQNGELPGSDDLDGAQKKILSSGEQFEEKPITTVSEQLKSDAVKKMVQDQIDEINKDQQIVKNNAFKVQYFRILPRDFSMQTGEITPTMKLKRQVSDKIWKDTIDEMYQA